MSEHEQTNEREQEIDQELRENLCQCATSEKWIKFFILALAVIIGTFLAMYFVADQVVKYTVFSPHFHHRMMERMMKDEQRMMHEMDKKNSMPLMRSMPQPYTAIADLVENEDGYRLIINLKHFDNDINKIKLDIKPDKVSIIGANESENKNSIHSLSFSQTFMLDEKINPDKVTKHTVKDRCTVFLPFAED